MPSSLAAQTADDRAATGNPLAFTASDDLQVNVLAKFQSDFYELSPSFVPDDDGFNWTRRRIGVEGTFLKHFEFQIEREIRRDNPWRDVFVDFQYFRNARLRGGKFKIPFGLDQLTNPARLDFVYRSRIGELLSPGRDLGMAVHGRFWNRALGYEAGVFRHDGEKARFQQNPGADLTWAGRVTARPFRPLTKAAVRSLELGFNATVGSVPEGLHGLRGRTTFDETFFEPVYVNGRRVRMGMDLSWTPGPFSLKSELIRLEDERRGQGLIGDDLPSIVSNGWYVSGSWLATGERKTARVEPRRPLFQGGVGAIELAARYEQLGFGSPSADGGLEDVAPALHPRAARLTSVRDHLVSVGVNWYLNRWVRVQVNAIREDGAESLFRDDSGAVIEPFLIYVCRLQFSL
jgi:phosphate-selective porin OprO/OprP